ncbi:hypothetical protein PRK78_004256 [Emydomyces testavorans]|uniref:Fe2OG dioxygenase domain-containing protein n=1 Tax=Emydomyces testavorans TaxID=2070801 RepID=A0AAF0DIA9_9EURO|nr:hypothetical protein PRK78_004256 [Emydomyces testavorans]
MTQLREQESEQPERKLPLSLQDFNRAILEVMTMDCKVDACIDKFIHEALRLPGRRAHLPWHIAEETEGGETPVDENQLEQIKSALFADLDNLVPEYGKVEFQNAATNRDKFDVLESKLMDRWDKWSSFGKSPSGDPKLHKKLLEALAARDSDSPEVRLPQSDFETDPSGKSYTPSPQMGELRGIIEDRQNRASFTCGGSIKIVRPQDERELLRQSLPIALYWSSEDGRAHKVELPEGTSSPNSSRFQRLVAECAPATFGLGQEDVLDLSYRRAGKLDADRFSTSFHPADFGILHSIEQTLLPNINSAQQNALEFRRVRAELYKLNVYSEPSGLFRAHVDTPRSQDQFGSLVVCLPSAHEGGTLIVRHHGGLVRFAWDCASSSHIQWAAFYSDCEHEIEHVTKGHRVTLTYNLFVTEPVGASLLPNPLVEPCSLPLYGYMEDLLSQEQFMKKGGILGVFCSHSYPHTSKEANLLLPRRLKGSDMALYAALKALGLWVRIMPILHLTSGGQEVGDLDDFRKVSDARYELRQFRKWGYTAHPHPSMPGVDLMGPPRLSYFHLFHSSDYIEDIHKRWRFLYKSRVPRSAGWPEFDIVGTGLHEKITDEWDNESPLSSMLEKYWPSIWLSGITWVNKPGDRKEALTRLVYGNESSIEMNYSSAAILAIIPPWDQRNTES